LHFNIRSISLSDRELLSPTRARLGTSAWHILALESCPRPTNQLTRNCAGIAGAALILFAMILYTDKTPFPALRRCPMPRRGAHHRFRTQQFKFSRSSAFPQARRLSRTDLILPLSLALAGHCICILRPDPLTRSLAISHNRVVWDLHGLATSRGASSSSRPIRHLRVNQRTLLTGAARCSSDDPRLRYP